MEEPTEIMWTPKPGGDFEAIGAKPFDRSGPFVFGPNTALIYTEASDVPEDYCLFLHPDRTWVPDRGLLKKNFLRVSGECFLSVPTNSGKLLGIAPARLVVLPKSISAGKIGVYMISDFSSSVLMIISTKALIKWTAALISGRDSFTIPFTTTEDAYARQSLSFGIGQARHYNSIHVVSPKLRIAMSIPSWELRLWALGLNEILQTGTINLEAIHPDLPKTKLVRGS